MVRDTIISNTPVQKTKPTIEWNDNDLKAYNDIGITPPDHVCMFEKRFLSRVDTSREPIKRTITTMVRLKAPDYSTPNRDRKEYVYYRERWEGVDWRGIPVNPVDHTIGVFTKQFTRPHINDQTGEVDYNVLDPTKAQLTYYIPYSKKTVDDIIAKSAPVNKQDIRFTIKFASADCPWGPRIDTRSEFTYEQFANWKWEDIYRWHVKPDIKAAMDFQDKTKSGYNLTYQPS